MRAPEWVVAIGLLALAVGSQLTWYRAPSTADLSGLEQISPDAAIQAPGVFENINLMDLSTLRVFAVILFISGGFLVLGALLGRTTQPAIAASVPTSWFGLIVSIMILVRVFDAPVDGAINKPGLYVSLIGALLLWLGGWWSMRDERGATALDLSPEPELVSRAEIDRRAPAPQPGS
jgi:hypothetical protein